MAWSSIDSAGGSIAGGTASPADGQIDATDRSASTPCTVIVQAMTVDTNGHPAAWLGTVSITLTR
jgi:hypothetical protein